MIARVVRSSVVEAAHEGAIAVVDSKRTVLASQGDVTKPFFMRSVAKPFQATVAQSLGADLPPEWLAVACASHGASPAHIAIIEAMLHDVGLSAGDLQCPPSWPLSDPARERLIRGGHRTPQAIWHNCSGKHAAMLRACAAQGWDTSSYLSPDHPLQVAVAAALSDLLGRHVGTPGIDGCGAPVWTATTVEIAAGYAQLGTEESMAPAWAAMHRFQGLTSDLPAAPVALGRWTETASKLGAEGVLGIAARSDLGIAIKVWDGAFRALGPVAGATLQQLGLIPPATTDRLHTELAVAILGGGRSVGAIEATVDLA